MIRRLRAPRPSGGYTLIEMLTVLVIMGIVIGSLTALFVQASNAEIDMNNRFQAQHDGHGWRSTRCAARSTARASRPPPASARP